MKILAFDSEFADKEILELSMHGITVDESATAVDVTFPESEEVFHQYFKPRTERRWPGSQRVHHISPQMVAHKPYITRFGDMIESLIGEADLLVGFALENDIEKLEGEGFDCCSGKKIVDVKDLYWLLHGKDDGVPMDSRKGLDVTAELLGMKFAEDKAHGASYDTLMTFKTFVSLIKEYAVRYPQHTLSQLIDTYIEEWEREYDGYYREFAKGYASLIPAPGGYRLKVTREKPDSKAEFHITVNARLRALDEIDAHFHKRRCIDKATVYNLKESDIQWFKEYKNEYDGNERMHKEMQKLRIMSVK